MKYTIRRKSGLLLVLLLLIVVTAAWERIELEGPRDVGDGMEDLCFTMKGGRSQQNIRCFTEEEKRISYLFLPSYVNMGSVTVSFEGADQIIFAGEKESIALKNGDKINCLEIQKSYHVRSERRGETLAEGDLVIMHSANLPAMFLETDSGSMEKIDADKEYEEPGKVVVYDVDGSVVCADKLRRISGRGNSTWAYPKKSYGIGLKNPADLFQMGSAANWILLSNVEDPSYIRNRITYDMAVAAGMEGAPQSCYIDLYINHKYHGMYQLCEKVEIDEERIPIANLGLENKRLNKGIGTAERFDTDGKRGALLKAEPADITGGYLLERDVASKYDAEVSGFETALLHDSYTIKSPKYASRAQVDYISELVSDMEKAVVAEDGVNPDTGLSYLDYIDLRSFAQKYIIEELSKNNGGGATSSFFYKPQDAVSTKLFGGPVWDYDKAYGRVYGFDSAPRSLCYLTQRGAGTTFFRHLSVHPEFQQMVSECYKDFFSDYIEKVYEELMVTYASEMYAAEEMDQIRWREIYGEKSDHSQRAEEVRSFLLERKAFLDEVWIEKKELCTIHFIAEDYLRDSYMSVIAGEAPGMLPIGEAGSESDGLIFDGWRTAEGELFDGSDPLWGDITVYGTGRPVQGK